MNEKERKQEKFKELRILKISLSRDVTKLTKLTKLVHYALMIISSKFLLLLIVQNTENDKMKHLKQANILATDQLLSTGFISFTN